MARDMDDEYAPPPGPPPAEPTWELLAAVVDLPDVPFRVTVAALQAAAEAFDVPVVVAPAELLLGGVLGWDVLARALGWVERVEVRGGALYGFVRWLCPERYPYGLAGVLEFGRDPTAGTPRLTGAIPREQRPAVPKERP